MRQQQDRASTEQEAYSDVGAFVDEFINIIRASSLHRSLVWASILDRAADHMIDLRAKADVATVRALAEDLRRFAIID